MQAARAQIAVGLATEMLSHAQPVGLVCHCGLHSSLRTGSVASASVRADVHLLRPGSEPVGILWHALWCGSPEECHPIISLQFRRRRFHGRPQLNNPLTTLTAPV